AIRLSPNNTLAITNYVEGFIRLNRFDEAQQVLEQMLGQNPDRGPYQYYAMLIAFAKGDHEEVTKHLDWLAKKPNDADYSDAQSNIAAFYGNWNKSLDFA